MSRDRTLPPLLAAINALPHHYAHGRGVDFEPYQAFQSDADIRAWVQAWTGNPAVDGAEYRVFGQDGTGGLAALWLVRPDLPLEAQPVVFFGSEGELGVVARNLDDYAWLLAGGMGPMEVITFGVGGEPAPQPELAAFVHARGGVPRDPATIISEARAEFPSFEADWRALCR